MLTLWLAASSGTSGSNLVPLYYIVSIIVPLVATAYGAMRWYRSQRKVWTQEGVHAQKQADALAANTEAAKKNTEAIGSLTAEMRDFVQETRAQLNSHGHRIERLEDYLPKRRPG